MNWVANLRLRAKLLGAFALVLTLAVACGLVGIVQIARVNASAQEMGGNSLPSVRYASQINTDVSAIRAAQLELALASSATEKAQAHDLLRAAQKDLEQARKRYEPLISSAQERQHYDAFNAAWTRYAQGAEAALAGLERGDSSAAARLARELAQPFSQASKAIDAAVHINVTASEASTRDAAQRFASGRTWMIATLVLATVLGLLLAQGLANQLAKPLQIAAESARAMAAGDLTIQIPSRGHDEVGVLLAALQTMQQGLSKVVGTVRNGVEQASTASAQIASGNQDLSSRTEQQASSLQETAASVEQMSSTVKQTSDSAREANQLAVSASQTAVDGGEVVGQVVHTMGEITESSRKIADIITVIDGIAFQTNILALNAAVEAARAGEQGRGFAVVASEVRNLAQRSAGAAKEIKTLITASVERVETGSKLVDQAGKTMGDVVQRVKRVADLIAEIDAAAREQSSGIVQINQAVTNLDQATQQNAALVEQSAAAAESMRDQMRKLSDAVAQFRVNEGGGLTAARAVVAAAPKTYHAPKAATPATAKPTPMAAPAPRATPAPKELSSPPAGKADDGDWSEF